MESPELREVCAQAWRETTAPNLTVPDRIAAARRDCQEELEQSRLKLAQCGPIIDDWSDAPFWIRAASGFTTARNRESLLSDPQCSLGWHPPFKVFPTKEKLYLSDWPGAVSATLMTTFLPHAWYLLQPASGYFITGLVLEWHMGPCGTDNRFDQKCIDKAIDAARQAIAAWQAFWANDAERQRDLPQVWFQTHPGRLGRQIAVVDKANTPDLDREDIRQGLAIGKAAKAVRDLSVALKNDAAEMAIPGQEANLHRLEATAAVAAERCPFVLQAELGTGEFWEAAREMSGALAAVATHSGRVKSAVPSRTKRSTSRGGARAKIEAALLAHHRYSDDRGLITQPIANNDLARELKVSQSVVSDFFKSQFGSHDRYVLACKDQGTLNRALPILSGDLKPKVLFKSLGSADAHLSSE